MKGFIKFTVDEPDADHTSMQVECNLDHVSGTNKLMLVDAMVNALDMDFVGCRVAAAMLSDPERKRKMGHDTASSVRLDPKAMDVMQNFKNKEGSNNE